MLRCLVHLIWLTLVFAANVAILEAQILTGRGGPIAVLTNKRGEFRFAQLQPGVCRLRVALGDLRSHVEPDLPVGACLTVEWAHTVIG